MGYSRNLVKGDIWRLISLFTSLREIFREQEIDDELLKKSVTLLETLDEMIAKSEQQCNVGNEQMQDEGGALDDEEKQHERSVLQLVKKHERRVLELKKHERSVLELKKDERSVLQLKEHERIVLQLWLEELQDAVFNTEDLVDKIHTEALRHKKLDGQICEKMEDIRCSLESYVKQGDVLGLAGPTYNTRCLMNSQGMQNPDDLGYRMESLDVWNESYDDWEMNLDDLKKSLDDRKKNLDDPNWKRSHDGWKKNLDYRMESLDDWSGRQPLNSADYIYFVDESEIFGMDCDKEEIIKLLLPDDASDKQWSVISIEGNGQIGKTTLARLFYNDQRVSHHFHLKAWVGVPDDFDSVTGSILNFFNLQYKDLKVLNSHYNYRDKIELRLQQCLEGKRFLLVLDGAKQTPSSKGWEALRYALKDAANGSCIIVTTRNKDIAPMMDAVSTHRMKPLSKERSWSMFAKFAFGDQNPTPDTQLEAIGKDIVQMCHGLPSSVRILGSLLRFKLQQEEWEDILERLMQKNVNFVPLPFISSQEYELVKDKLRFLRMAEGMEFDFPEPPIFRNSMKGVDKSLAANVYTRYFFRLEDNHPSHIPLNTRFLLLVGGKYENSVIFEAIDRTKSLRTFLALDHESRHLCATELQKLLSNLQFLRVLSLSHYHITEIPDSIGNLEHLRYIDLSHTPIKRLPESVCELYNLQSLMLSNCHSLTELPENTSNLNNLIYLDVSGSGLSEMPKLMRKLRNLKYLPCFVAGKEKGSLRQLCHMSKLEGTLLISKLQNVIDEDGADILYLAGTCYLDELALEWDDNTADPENATKVLARLIPGPSPLKKLTINFYCGTNLADFFTRRSFRSIVFLRLSNCKNCSSLPPLGELRSLRVLIIECMDAVEEVGPDFSAVSKSDFSAETSTRKTTEFEYLERLTFEGMSKWTKWVPFDEFPSLKQLCIRRCPKLRGNLPKQLPLVERVEISESQELVTALTAEASLNNLHYREKIVFISDDIVTSFTSERVTAGSSSLNMVEGKVIKKPKQIEERGETEEETNVKIQTTSETNWSKHEQKESTEDPSQFPSSEEKSSVPLPQHAAECSSLVTPASKTLIGTLETEGRGESEEEPGLEITKASKTKGTEVEQKEFIEDEKSSLPSTQSATTSSFPTAEGVVEESGKSGEADDLSDTWSNSSFESMKVSEISELMALPTPLHSLKIEACDGLRSIPESLITSLQHLYIINCCSLESFPKGMAFLKILYIRNCKKLDFPPANENIDLDALEDLSVGSSCASLTDLSLYLFPKLRTLSIWDCANLQKLSKPEKIQIELTSLEALEIRDCPNLEYFPTGGLPTPNLKSIWLSNCNSLKKLPDRLGTLKHLESMFINNCPELESLSKEVLPSELSLLRITFCNKLIPGKEWGLHGLASLCQLEIEGECKNVESFPVEELLPSNLSSLRISGLSDLKKLDNTGLKKLESLKTLEISCCPNLESLPEDGFPSSLSFLCIKECPLLKPKLQNKFGEDWSKIAHISCIEIDEEVIS